MPQAEVITKHQPATPLTPFQKFYNAPSPSGAIDLALADSFAYVAPMMPDGDYVKMLHKARERSDAYPKLIEFVRAAAQRLDKATTSKARDILRELGEAE